MTTGIPAMHLKRTLDNSISRYLARQAQIVHVLHAAAASLTGQP